jgi:hypothetical protein
MANTLSNFLQFVYLQFTFLGFCDPVFLFECFRKKMVLKGDDFITVILDYSIFGLLQILQPIKYFDLLFQVVSPTDDPRPAE